MVKENSPSGWRVTAFDLTFVDVMMEIWRYIYVLLEGSRDNLEILWLDIFRWQNAIYLDNKGDCMTSHEWEKQL